MGPLQIPITGIGPDWIHPGGYAEIRFNQGAAGAFAPGREVCFVMPKTSAGTWTVNTLYAVPDEKTASDGAGPGSFAHRACKAFRRNNQDAKLWAIVYNASSGGGGAASATGTVAISGPATAAGTFAVIVCGQRCEAGFASGDTATTIGDYVAAVINNRTDLPCTAANVTGTVTLTAKIIGASSGNGTLFPIRLHTEITSGTGVTATTSTGLGSVIAGADGTTTEAANQSTALAVLNGIRKYWVGISTMASTEYGQLTTHITTKSEPKRGLRSAGLCAYTGSLSNAQTLAIARNYERLSMIWQPNSEHDPATLVGTIAAIVQKFEDVRTNYNFDGFPLSNYGILPAYSASDIPTPDNINDALNDGLLPIASNDGGASIVMFTTTHSKTAAAGTLDDRRSLERHRVSVADEFVDEELAELALNFAGKGLADDKKLPDGKFDPNQLIPANTTTPSSFRPHLNARYDRFESAGKLQKVDVSKAALRIEKNGGRLEVGGQLHATDLLHQVTYRFDEVSEG